jgi:hypothetical protein
MKKILLTSAFFLITSLTISSQVTQSAPTGEAGLFGNAQGGNPMLNLVFADLRNKKVTRVTEEISGSPYLNIKFIESKIFYDNEFVGKYFIRYNAFNSEIEIKESFDQTEIKKLIADKKLRVSYKNRELRFTTYINKKKQTKNGYLSMIFNGKNYKLYYRLAIKYVEGKSAANSMINGTPSRYAPFEEFYFQKNGVNQINQVLQKKSKFLKQITKEKREAVLMFIKEETIDLKKENDLIKLFTYLDSI